jgi:hypothetical protein
VPRPERVKGNKLIFATIGSDAEMHENEVFGESKKITTRKVLGWSSIQVLNEPNAA